MNNLEEVSYGASRAFEEAHARLLTDLGSALSTSPAGDRLADAADAYADVLRDAVADDGERLVDTFGNYLDALQGALREGDPSLDDALREYLRAVREAWLEIDVDDLDVDALASVAQGTTAAAWLMSTARRPVADDAPSWPADHVAPHGAMPHRDNGADADGIVWQQLGSDGWGAPSGNGDRHEDAADDPLDDEAYEDVYAEEGEWDDGGDGDVPGYDEDEDEDDDLDVQWHTPAVGGDTDGIVWQELRPGGSPLTSARFEPMAREESEMADATSGRRSTSATKRAAPAEVEEVAPATPLVTALDDALQRYLNDARDAFAPASVRNRAERAYQEYQRVIAEIGQTADLQQKVVDLYTSYSRALQGLGSYDEVVQAYLRVVQAGSDSNELVGHLQETYQELLSAAADASRTDRRQAALDAAYARYTTAVQDAWSRADSKTLNQQDLLSAARNMATVTTVQALGSSAVAPVATTDRAPEEAPPASATPSRTTGTSKKAATPSRPSRATAKATKRPSRARKRTGSPGG